jgi:hypothetical protein
MINQAPWARKVFDEPRVGFVAEYGSQLHPRMTTLEPAARPPAPGSSPLDKIIDEDRLGFAEAQRADEARRATGVRKLIGRSPKPQSV